MVSLSPRRSARPGSTLQKSLCNTLFAVVFAVTFVMVIFSPSSIQDEHLESLNAASKTASAKITQLDAATPIVVRALKEIVKPTPTSVSLGATTSFNAFKTGQPSLDVAPDYQLAFAESLGFFDDIPQDLWERYYKDRARKAEHYRNPESPNSRMGYIHHWKFFNWDPFFTCPRLDKVGGLGDGPKWTCDIDRIGNQAARRKMEAQKQANYDPAEKHCIVYSIGSNGDYQFEDAVVDALDMACEVHIFDMGNFDRGETNTEKGITYHKMGLKSSYHTATNQALKRRGKSIVTKSFQEIQKMLGHENKTVDIFKIDCEGCEWTTYLDWVNADVRQILIETHDLPKPNKVYHSQYGDFPKMEVSNYFDAFKQAGFVLYNKEVNSAWGEGKAVEWSYLKLDTAFLGDSIARTSTH